MRYFIELSYKGKDYHGWQIQPDVITVQKKLNDAFSKILNTPILTVGAGRTDTGVHASQMFCHVDSDIELDTINYIFKLNSILPNDIVIHQIFKVKENAHVRFDAVFRSYEYQIYLGRNAFLLDTTWQVNHQKLDISKMNKAAEILLQHKNYKCFSKTHTDVGTYNCTITNAEWKLDNHILTFHITADRFLRNMVRAIVGTLIDIGKGKTSNSDFIKIIESQNRSMAGTSAPAQGLSLTSVTYPETIKYE